MKKFQKNSLSTSSQTDPAKWFLRREFCRRPSVRFVYTILILCLHFHAHFHFMCELTFFHIYYFQLAKKIIWLSLRISFINTIINDYSVKCEIKSMQKCTKQTNKDTLLTQLSMERTRSLQPDIHHRHMGACNSSNDTLLCDLTHTCGYTRVCK
jgi:hypothetical protein